MTPRSMKGGRAGFTLLELVVAVALGLFLTAAAVVFATTQTKMLSQSGDALEMQQSARVTLDQLAYDLQMAGAGIGTDETGNYAGLQVGQNFPAIGGLLMNSTGANGWGAYTEIQLRRSDITTGAEAAAATYTMRTEDLGIRMADGAYATIAAHSGTAGQYCDDGTVVPGTDTRYAVIEDNVRLGLRSVLFTPGASTGCAYGFCQNGCRAFTIAADPTNFYQSTPTAAALSYTSGEVRIGLKQVLWFVETDAQNPSVANLRRAELNGLNPATNPGNQCVAGGRATCGAEFAFNVESLQYQIWRFDPTRTDDLATNQVDERWVYVNTPLFRRDAGHRLRVDVEVVVRSARQESRPMRPEPLRLRPGNCAPGGTVCPSLTNASQWDYVARRAHRMSVEVKNTW